MLFGICAKQIANRKNGKRSKAYKRQRSDLIQQMRDVQRIDEILNLIKEEWSKHPQMRFTQFLVNKNIITHNPIDFELEDGVVIEKLKHVKF